MSNTNTGGPAFASGYVRYSRPLHDPGASMVETDRMQPLNKGLSLRDYFAAKASEDDIGAHSLKGFKEEYVLDLGNGDKELRTREARWSREQAKFRYADAMLKAREA